MITFKYYDNIYSEDVTYDDHTAGNILKDCG